MSSKKHIFVLAGEASGDALGGPLLQALLQKTGGHVRFSGVGGELMQQAGLESLYPMSDLSVMGFFEVFKHLPRLLSRLRQTRKYILKEQPDVVVTIDLPDFSFRLAKQLRGSGIPYIHYPPPTVWAWRPKRAKKIAPVLDHLLAILPFEPPYFEKEGLPTTFVGHYVVEAGIDTIDRQKFRDDHEIAKETLLLCLLPGSRQREIDTLLPIFKQAVAKLRLRYPDLKIVIPTTTALKEQVSQAVDSWSAPSFVVTGAHEKYAAMRASNVALAASGTVNLELAMARTPFVIAYQVNRLTGWLARKILNVRYVAMVNIMHDRLVVPELLQEKCEPNTMVQELDKLLSSARARQQQIEAFEDVCKQLQVKDVKPSEKAAEVVLRLMALT
ncbi:MAG: lipid-A-disaccharide synthase [Pseudomonadota bacterium]